MTTVVVPQTNPNDEVTANSVNQGPNAIATVMNGNLDDSNISALSGSKISAGTVPANAMTTAANPETRMNETLAPFVASGLVWSILSGLNGAMTAGVAYVDGKRLTVAAITSRTFTASRDTYIYISNTGAVQYVEVTNGAAQPATPASTVLVAKGVTSASALTSFTALPGKPVTAIQVDTSAFKFPFPDYANPVAISTTTYTAPSNGWITMRSLLATTQADSAATATVGAVEIYRLHWAANLTNYNIQSTAMVPIAKGQTVTFALANGAQWSFRTFLPALS